MANATKDKTTEAPTEAPAPEAPGFQLDIVDEIPSATRGGGGSRERSSELRRFYEALTAQPVGTKARFKSGVYSPNYGGDNAKVKFPRLKMAARRTGTEKGTGKDGADRGVFDIYGEHIDPQATPAVESNGDSIV